MRFLFLSVVILLTISCKDEITYKKLGVTSQDLIKSWRLTEITFNDDFYKAMDSHSRKKIQGQIGLGYLLTLFPDQVATKLLGNDLDVLEWKFTVDSLIILENKDQKDTFKILLREENKGFRFIECAYKNIGKFKFLEEHSMLDDVSDDPYHPSLNRWRIPAKTYESDGQLELRIMNYLDHYKALLKSSTERPNAKIRLMNSRGPIRVFDGGIGLLAKEVLPKEWLHTYYSDSQAYDVFDKLNRHFTKRIIHKKTSNGWRMDDYSLIDSLQSIY